MKKGIVFDIKEFAVHDGPGIRTTVFLKGCPLRCSWCHNPEGISPKPQILHTPIGTRLAGEEYTPRGLADLLNQQATFLTENEGGVTFSGGEPLFQADFLIETIALLDEIHLLLDTSGYAPTQDFARLAARVDLIYLDMKSLDAQVFRQYCGGDLAVILANLEQLKTMSTPVVIRAPLIPGVTDSIQNMTAIARAAASLPTLQRVDLLAYQVLAAAKYPLAGLSYNPGFDEKRSPQIHGETFDKAGIPWRVV
ncbi:MAG: radical SAM protein [Chloroflexi bacterium]|nr:radical SAM protein [Chloroflexota bacterium]